MISVTQRDEAAWCSESVFGNLHSFESLICSHNLMILTRTGPTSLTNQFRNKFS